MTAGITLERKLTLGNLLTVGTVLVTVAITWGVLTAQAAQTADDVTDLKSAVAQINVNRFDDNSRMVRVETLLGQILSEVKNNRTAGN